MNHVDIILSVYNGEKYLKEQLNSIFSQTHQNFKLIIRDNGSTDISPEILKSYSLKYPDKVFIDPNHKQILPLYLSFSALLNFSTSPYVMFCDADDVWLERKIEKSLSKIQDLEATHSKLTPCLVFSDLYIVDQSLNVVSNSMFRFQSLKPDNMKLNYLLAQDIACGNTYILNQSLLKLINPIPHGAGMHDIWASLVAVSLGKVSYLKEPLILYRQHGNNVCGSVTIIQKSWWYLKRIKSIRSKIDEKFQIARVFSENFSYLLSDPDKKIIREFLNIHKANYFQKRKIIFKNKFYFNTLLGTIAFLIFV